MNFDRLYSILIFFGVVLIIAIPLIIIKGCRTNPQISEDIFKYQGSFPIKSGPGINDYTWVNFTISDVKMADSLTSILRMGKPMTGDRRSSHFISFSLQGIAPDDKYCFDVGLTKYRAGMFTQQSCGTGFAREYTDLLLYDFFRDYFLRENIADIDAIRQSNE